MNAALLEVVLHCSPELLVCLAALAAPPEPSRGSPTLRVEHVARCLMEGSPQRHDAGVLELEDVCRHLIHLVPEPLVLPRTVFPDVVHVPRGLVRRTGEVVVIAGVEVSLACRYVEVPHQRYYATLLSPVAYGRDVRIVHPSAVEGNVDVVIAVNGRIRTRYLLHVLCSRHVPVDICHSGRDDFLAVVILHVGVENLRGVAGVLVSQFHVVDVHRDVVVVGKLEHHSFYVAVLRFAKRNVSAEKVRIDLRLVLVVRHLHNLFTGILVHRSAVLIVDEYGVGVSLSHSRRGRRESYAKEERRENMACM